MQLKGSILQSKGRFLLLPPRSFNYAAALMRLIGPTELEQLLCRDSSNGRKLISSDRQTPLPIEGSVRDKELHTLNIELAELSLEKQREKVP